MLKSSNETMWSRPLTSRRPTARDFLIFFTLLFLIYHFHTWRFDYSQRPTGSEGAASSLPGESSPRPPPQDPDGIPKKIWYKLGPKGLSDDARQWTDTCINQNPEYHAEFLTDQSADAFVNESFASRRDIIDVYDALTIPILKADMLRYLLLYAEGGIWLDLDASCEGVPIKSWIPAELEEDADLVVGWEFDGGYHFEFDRQFVTWTVLSKKNVSHLLVVVEDIIESIRETVKSHNVTISELKMDMIGDVVDFTGPKRFAKSVMKNLERSLEMTAGWNWDQYHEILEPKLAGDVLILPGYSLAASYNTYEEGDLDRVGPPLVKHHYAGTWKNEYGGERV